MVKGKKPILHRKLVRDMQQNFMQFLAMMLLCALGTWVFTGLDASWRMQEITIESFFQDQNLADFWVNGAYFSRQDLSRIRHIRGVKEVIARSSMEFDVEDVEGKVTARVHAYDGAMTINTPCIRDGSMLNMSDQRGCMVEEQFAQAQGWKTGDLITLSLGGVRYSFVIRATVLSPEYLMTAKDTAPDPSGFGFILLSLQALPQYPINDILVAVEDGADERSVEKGIEEVVPGAVILSQKTHGSTVSGRNYVNLFQKMSYIFPVLAYFVAALIVITTLSRMMDSQRIQMGTLKALGYRKQQIRRHYVFYAVYPSLLGSAIGIAAAQVTLPQILWMMVAVNVRVPREILAPISPISWAMAAAEVVLSILICIRNINRAAKESTADLLRPKPPKSGARILLERWKWVWRRVSFNMKMVIRNIFRSKGRTMLSMVGMLFCNMLIICSFGLQESIPFFIREHFYETITYDVRVDLNTEKSGPLESYRHRIDAGTVDGVMETSIRLCTDSMSRTSLLTVLPEDQSVLRLGEDHTLLEMPEEGLMVTEKLASMMGIQTGSTVEMWLPGDDQAVRVTVRGIASSNIGQTAYMSRNGWERLHKGAFRPNALLIKGLTPLGKNQLDNMDEINSFKYPDNQFQQTMRVMDSATAAFSVLSLVALGLAFVICYNMGLLNFTERTREYATLKVLGYHQKEIRRLMLHENSLVSVFGVAAGIVPGVILVRIILKMCEFDTMIFVPHVTYRTILLSSAVTFAFTWFIEWLLTRKVRGIDMVEALKSVE